MTTEKFPKIKTPNRVAPTPFLQDSFLKEVVEMEQDPLFHSYVKEINGKLTVDWEKLINDEEDQKITEYFFQKIMDYLFIKEVLVTSGVNNSYFIVGSEMVLTPHFYYFHFKKDAEQYNKIKYKNTCYSTYVCKVVSREE